MGKLRVFDYVLLGMLLIVIFLSIFHPIILPLRDIQIQESSQKIVDPHTGIEQTNYQKIIIKKFPTQPGISHLVQK